MFPGASDVFARMFEIKMSECQTGQVVIEDLEPHIVEMMLRFMYSRKAPELKDVETGISLYEAADKVCCGTVEGTKCIVPDRYITGRTFSSRCRLEVYATRGKRFCLPYSLQLLFNLTTFPCSIKLRIWCPSAPPSCPKA